MNEKIATALHAVSLAIEELAEAIQQPGSVERRESDSRPSPSATTPVSAATREASPFEDESVTWTAPDALEPILAATGGVEVGTQSERDRVLAECPVHFRAWTIKEGGISKNGQPYKAFWKCNGKNDDGSFCNKKPEAGWVKTHNAEKALAASAA